MRVKDIMTTAVDTLPSTSTIAEAARLMADDDVGVLPVLSGDRLVGIVTDRDIAVRGVAAHISPDDSIRRVMSENVTTCSPDDEIEDVLGIMAQEQIRRMPVCDNRERVIGIVALADAAQKDSDKREVAEALAQICEPSGLHCQAPVFA
jgi:CBS domain-containing protein